MFSKNILFWNERNKKMNFLYCLDEHKNMIDEIKENMIKKLHNWLKYLVISGFDAV